MDLTAEASDAQNRLESYIEPLRYSPGVLLLQLQLLIVILSEC